MQEKYHQTFYIISDSVGETAIRVTNAALAQFPTFTDSSVKRFPFINTLEELTEI
ncbi:MAG: kinase/pyrophosphorylase, partial [Ruoffia tabacinasalis]